MSSSLSLAIPRHNSSKEKTTGPTQQYLDHLSGQANYIKIKASNGGSHTHLKIGHEVQRMTDQEILDHHNQVLRVQNGKVAYYHEMVTTACCGVSYPTVRMQGATNAATASQAFVTTIPSANSKACCSSCAGCLLMPTISLLARLRLNGSIGDPKWSAFRNTSPNRHFRTSKTKLGIPEL